MKNKKIKIAAFIALFSIVSFTASAQNKELKVGTNPTIKEASAVFEVENANKGALLPRVALTSTIVAAPITAPANALTVFNTNTAGDVTPGYYYWSTVDSKWVRMSTINDQDLRLVGTNNHITQDAGIGSNGTTIGGQVNVGIGPNSLMSNTTGTENMAIGQNTLAGNIGGHANVALGGNAMRLNNSGGWNTSVGTSALYNNSSGSYNAAFGNGALASVNGSNNVALGSQAGNTLTSGSQNIFIGAGVQPNVSNTGSSQLNIGNWIYGDNGKIGVGAAAIIPSERFDVGNGHVRVRDINTNTGLITDNIVVADANGVLKTVTAASIASSVEPWYDTATNTPATTNTQNINQKAKVAVGFDNPLGYDFSHQLNVKNHIATKRWGAAPNLVQTRYNGTEAAPTAVLVNDQVGALTFEVYTGGGIAGARPSVADIKVWAAENATPATTGGSFTFNTSPIGTIAPVQRMTILENGNVGIGLPSVISSTRPSAPTNTLHVSATTDPVRIEGLATGLTTDNIVVADANGVLKTVAKSTFAADLRLVGANNHITQDAGVGSNGTSVGTGTHLVAIGASALSNNTSGSQSVAIGSNAMLQSTTATQTVAMGHNALRSNTTGNNNVAIGWNALFNNITGNKSVAVGKSAMSTYTGTGEGQIALGYEALNGLTTGTANIGIGFDAMRGLTTGNNNIAIGEKTLNQITTASNNNIAIGYTAGSTLTSGSNNVLIGNAVTPNVSATGSNQLNINNWIYGNNGNIGVGAAAINPSERLDVGNGNVRVRDINTNTGAASDNIVVADANGVLKTVAATNFNNNWKLTGNAGTNPYNPANGTDFLGTTDATDFQIKVGTTAPYNNIMRVKNAQGHVQFGNWLDIAVSPMVQNADHFTSNGAKLDAPANFAVQNNFAASDLPASAAIINGSRSASYLNASSDKTFYGDMNYTEISNAGYTGQISANYNQLRLASGATYTAATTNGVIAGGQNLLSINAGATLNGSSGNGSVAGFSFYTNAGTVNGAAAGMQSRTSNSGTFNGTYAGLQGIISSGNTFNGQVYGAQSNISAGIFNNITGAALIGVDATITGGTFAANTSTYGLRSNVTAANIRNGYGLYIEDVAGTVSQQGIFQVGTNDINNLAGSTRIGSTLAPSNTLHVTAAANPVRFEGLQAGASTDNIVVADANGVLKTVAASTSAAIRTETANYAALATDETILVDATSGTVTVTLPATPTVGKRYNLKKIDASANAATVSGNGNNIDGNATISGTLPFQGWVMQFDGDNWFIISRI